METNERSSKITMGGEEYELLLTTRATKEIAKKFGGLSNLGSRLEGAGFDEAIEDVVWLIATLANQTIHIHNLQNPDLPRELLTEEKIELLTTPRDLALYKDAILSAMVGGTKRNVTSDEPPKNAVCQAKAENHPTPKPSPG